MIEKALPPVPIPFETIKLGETGIVDRGTGRRVIVSGRIYRLYCAEPTTLLDGKVVQKVGVLDRDNQTHQLLRLCTNIGSAETPVYSPPTTYLIEDLK